MKKVKSEKVKSGKKQSKPVVTGKKAREMINKSRSAFAEYLKEQGEHALLGVQYELYGYIDYASEGITVIKKLSDYISENRDLFRSGHPTEGVLICIGTEQDVLDAIQAKATPIL